MGNDGDVQPQESELKAGVKIEVIFDVSARRQEQNAHYFLGAFKLIQDLPHVGCAPELFGFLVVIGAGGAGENRLLASHGIKRDSRPLTFVVGSWLRRAANFL